jgi:hypothetical protein
LLGPLTASRQELVARQAALWAARASLRLEESDSAARFWRITGEDVRDWELASFHLAGGRIAAAESALVRRAAAGDRSPRLDSAVLGLWSAGHRDAAERMLDAADGSRLSPLRVGRMHIALGDLWVGHDDSVALSHFERAARISRDTLVSREAAARRLAMMVRQAGTVSDVDAAIVAARGRARGSELFRRIEDHLLLIKLLQARADLDGGGHFLAAEVARDSLRAPRLAASLFRALAEGSARSPFAPKALLAVSAITPDSAEILQRALQERYPGSPYTRLGSAGAGAARDSAAALDAALQQTWTAIARAWMDSVSRLRRDPRAPLPGVADSTARSPR